MFDTTLPITRMIFEGFFDQYPNMKVIASHGGGTLPYLVGRFEPLDVDAYMAGQRSAALLIVHDGKLRLERYGLGFDSSGRRRPAGEQRVQVTPRGSGIP
jgi:hypothetical protein